MAVSAAEKGSQNMHDIRTFHQGTPDRVRSSVWRRLHTDHPVNQLVYVIFHTVITRDGHLASYEDSLKEVLERTEGHRVTALHVGMF